MDTTSLLALLIPACLVLAFVCIVLVVVMRRGGRPRSGRPRPLVGSSEGLGGEAPAQLVEPLPYVRQRYLLTQAEREFFAVLQRAAPAGWHVFPQVRLANVVQLKKGTRNWKPHFSRIAQKCVDFVLCDERFLSPMLVVELDDSSHDRADRQVRDEFVNAALQSAGMPILHVRWQRQYDERELTDRIRAAAGLPADIPERSTLAPVAIGSESASRQSIAPAPERVAVATATRWSCPRCNREVGATAKFCSGCGATLEL